MAVICVASFSDVDSLQYECGGFRDKRRQQLSKGHRYAVRAGHCRHRLYGGGSKNDRSFGIDLRASRYRGRSTNRPRGIPCEKISQDTRRIAEARLDAHRRRCGATASGVHTCPNSTSSAIRTSKTITSHVATVIRTATGVRTARLS